VVSAKNLPGGRKWCLPKICQAAGVAGKTRRFVLFSIAAASSETMDEVKKLLLSIHDEQDVALKKLFEENETADVEIVLERVRANLAKQIELVDRILSAESGWEDS